MLFGFFFVVVSSRITGEIGVSANPISGMTIAALIGTATIFLLIGWTGVDHRVGALTIAAVIAVAAGNAGATSQDLKTGFLVGATPKRQQIGILVGAVTSALAIGWTLTLLNNTYTNIVPEPHPGVALEAAAPGEGTRSVTTLGERMRHDGREWEVVRVNLPTEGVQPGKYLVDPGTHEVAYLVDPGIGGRIREIDGRPITKLDSPKATIMALVTDGILTQKLPWGLVLIGVFLTISIEIMGLQSLPIAVGVYLPISTSASMFAGGVSAGWSSAGARAAASRWPRWSRVPACSSPADSSPAAPSRASRSPASRRRWWAGPMRPGFRRRTTWPMRWGCRSGSAPSPRTTSWRWRSSPAWATCSTASRAAEVPPTARSRRRISARIIHGALMLGVLMFWLVAWYVGRRTALPAEALPDRRVLYIALALVSAMLFGGAMFTAARLVPPAPAPRRTTGGGTTWARRSSSGRWSRPRRSSGRWPTCSPGTSAPSSPPSSACSSSAATDRAV